MLRRLDIIAQERKARLLYVVVQVASFNNFVAQQLNNSFWARGEILDTHYSLRKNSLSYFKEHFVTHTVRGCLFFFSAYWWTYIVPTFIQICQGS